MKFTLFSLIVLLISFGCKAQKIVNYNKLKYVSYSNSSTLNNSFINKRMVFLNGKDSVFFNIKIAFDLKEKKIYDPGIFYNCKLETDSIYSFSLKKIVPSEIPKEYNTYYRTNCVFNKESSRFKEYKKKTKYLFVGNTGMFVDINHELFKIIKMTPATGCTMQL